MFVFISFLATDLKCVNGEGTFIGLKIIIFEKKIMYAADGATVKIQ
jgi:hypothetical protein